MAGYIIWPCEHTWQARLDYAKLIIWPCEHTWQARLDYAKFTILACGHTSKAIYIGTTYHPLLGHLFFHQSFQQ